MKPKDQLIYDGALERALRIVKEHGVEELENEVRFRHKNPLPCNITRRELIAAARVFAQKELDLVGTASARTLEIHMKMPPSVVLEYLKHFNATVRLYHEDIELFEEDQEKMARNYAMNEITKQYWEDEENEQAN